MHSSNIPPPPPPSYIEATGTGFVNQYNTQYSTPLQTQQHFHSAQQQPFGQPVVNQAFVGPMQPTVTTQHNVQMISGLPRPRYLQLQRLAIMAMVCCLPLGIFAWLEFKKAKAAFNRGAQGDGERHITSLKRFAFCALFFGFLLFIIIIINPARIIQWVSGDNQSEEHDEDKHD